MIGFRVGIASAKCLLCGPFAGAVSGTDVALTSWYEAVCTQSMRYSTILKAAKDFLVEMVLMSSVSKQRNRRLSTCRRCFPSDLADAFSCARNSENLVEDSHKRF